jgi:hypothetical protein
VFSCSSSITVSVVGIDAATVFSVAARITSGKADFQAAKIDAGIFAW